MKSNRSLIRRAALVAATASTALVLAACGGGGHDMGSMQSDSPSSSSSPSASTSAPADAHNTADTAFAQEMIPHHRQAVEMAGLAATRASSAEVKDLATKIEGAQGPEIETMTGWLTAWGEPVPEEMPGMDHSAGMPGMMSTQDMASLQAAKGSEFDTMWLQMMIQHHQGAIDMAKTELSQGSNTDAKALAQKIIDGQQSEITEMKGLLGQS